MKQVLNFTMKIPIFIAIACLATQVHATSACSKNKKICSKTCKSKLKNYVYIKAGVARTQYNKFKDGSDSIYIIKKPKVALMYHIGLGHRFTESIRADLSAQYGKLYYKGKDNDHDLKQKIRLFLYHYLQLQVIVLNGKMLET